MKKSILTICLLVATVVCSNVTAQTITGVSQAEGINRTKVECEVGLRKQDISITGNNKKDYLLIDRRNSYTDYKFIITKTGGRAETTFYIIVDGVEDVSKRRTFENGKLSGVITHEFNNMAGKSVVLRVKNHSATNKIEGNVQGYINTNSMLIGPRVSDDTITERITQSFEQTLNMPCNGKGTIEITRLGGVSSAEIVVFQGGNSSGYGATVLKTVTMSANETTKRINLNNINPNSGTLRFEIRNIQTNKFIRAKIGAWFN